VSLPVDGDVDLDGGREPARKALYFPGPSGGVQDMARAIPRGSDVVDEHGARGRGRDQEVVALATLLFGARIWGQHDGAAEMSTLSAVQRLPGTHPPRLGIDLDFDAGVLGDAEPDGQLGGGTSPADGQGALLAR